MIGSTWIVDPVGILTRREFTSRWMTSPAAPVFAQRVVEPSDLPTGAPPISEIARNRTAVKYTDVGSC